MTSSALKRCSFEEYLSLEESSEVKHEYYDGEIFAMAGGTAAHSLAATNFAGEARAQLKASGCMVHGSDMKVLTPSGLGTYPDVTVACDQPRYEDEKKTTLLNPQAVVEVLLESTEAYDRGKKFDHYQSIKSLAEYVLVSQDRAHVDLFTRQADGKWLLTSFDGLEATVELPTLGCGIPVIEVYRGVEFPPEQPPQDDTKPADEMA